LVGLKVKRKKMNNQSNIFFNLDPNNNQKDPTVDKRGKEVNSTLLDKISKNFHSPIFYLINQPNKVKMK
jgi:hypothetical protein